MTVQAKGKAMIGSVFMPSKIKCEMAMVQKASHNDPAMDIICVRFIGVGVT
jgi:hypothetical protein